MIAGELRGAFTLLAEVEEKSSPRQTHVNRLKHPLWACYSAYLQRDEVWGFESRDSLAAAPRSVHHVYHKLKKWHARETKMPSST